MSHFEFVFVLVSIVLGLGLANLLNGLATALQSSWRDVDPIHLAFSFGMILAIFVVWWGMYRWQTNMPFEFGTFAIIGLYTSVFYTISVILFPRDGRIRSFDEIRLPFYITLILYLLLELAYYAVGEFSPATYYYYVWVSALLLFITAAWLKKPWMDSLVAVVWFGLFSSWWFIARLTA